MDWISKVIFRRAILKLDGNKMGAIAPAKQQYCHRALFSNQEMRARAVLFLARVKLHSLMPP